VADAEEARVILAWEESDRVALDTPGIIQRIWNLHFELPRLWIGGALVEQVKQRPSALMWVKGHQGVKRLAREQGRR